jgi:hypothetical protein
VSISPQLAAVCWLMHWCATWRTLYQLVRSPFVCENAARRGSGRQCDPTRHFAEATFSIEVGTIGNPPAGI